MKINRVKVCSRYSQTRPLEKLRLRFHAQSALGKLRRRFNLAPSQPAPVIVANGERLLDLYRWGWGLIPSWAKDPVERAVCAYWFVGHMTRRRGPRNALVYDSDRGGQRPGGQNSRPDASHPQAVDEYAWLDLTARPEHLATLLVPYPADEMIAYAVSPLVNSPRNDSPDVIAPVGGESGTLF